MSGEGSGNVHFQAGNISVLEESAIISNVLGAEDGGEVLIRASESVEIIGTDTEEFTFPTAFFNETELGTTGNAGTLSVETDTFLVDNNAFISNRLSGAGNGGNLNITANEVSVAGGSSLFYLSGLFTNISEFEVVDKGGEINISASNVQMTNGALISGSTAGDGDGGNINLSVEETLTIDGEGNFGFTAIASQVGTLDFNGNIASGQGNGGQITINASNVQMTNGGGISVATAGDGDGGNINLSVEETLTIDGAGNFGFSGIDSQVGGVDLNRHLPKRIKLW